MRDTRHRGFTLIEMLVVISVICLLVAMLVPSFQAARSAGRGTVCSTKLHNIGTAFFNRRADEKVIGNVGATDKDNWVSNLFTYLNNDPEAFRCTEDSEVGFFGKENVRILVKDSSGNSRYSMDLFGYGDNAPWNTRDRPTDGDLAWKMSEGQFSEFKAKQGERVRAWDFMHRYDPGSNPNVYYMVYEDWRNPDGTPVATCDYDYDIGVRVEERSDGGISVSVASTNSTGFRFTLVGPNGEQISALNSGVLDKRFSMGGIHTSYGANSQIDAVRSASSVVLSLDYYQPVAQGEDAAYDNWTGTDVFTPTGAYKFARHLNKCNVLFADQSVQPMDPLEINPAGVANRAKYWKP